MRARTLEKYLARQIYGATAFVLLGFLGLFAFFDLIRELADLGKVNYNLRQVFTFVLLSMPTHAYELFPVVVLIGTLYVLAQLASNSEYTVMRASGLSPRRAAAILAKIGLAFVVLTFVIGEWGAPWAEEQAQKVKLRAMSSMIGQDLESGLWFKDERAFINVRQAQQTNQLMGVRIYEFDPDYRLESITVARRAEYAGEGVWKLFNVGQTTFTDEGPRTVRRSQLVVKVDDRILLVQAEDLIHASLNGDEVIVVASQVTGTSNYRTLDELQAQLDPAVFWRVHRSYLVNINKIKEIVPWFSRNFILRMRDAKSTEIPVSRAQTKRLREYLQL